MLLFVRNPYYSAIKAGVKRFELRAGARYRNVKVGDWLSINGAFRVRVTDVDVLTGPQHAALMTRAWGYPISVEQIRACYTADQRMYAFHFEPPEDLTGNDSARSTPRASAQSAVSF